MALDDALVMAPSLEEAAVMLEAELARKSVRSDRNSQTRQSSGINNHSPADDNISPPALENSLKTPSIQLSEPVEISSIKIPSAFQT